MKASAIRPAVTSAMGKPSKALGHSLETSSCSRTAGKQEDSQQEAQTAGDAIDHGSDEIVAVLSVQQQPRPERRSW